jgi:Ca-activated chloride channel homolog
MTQQLFGITVAAYEYIYLAPLLVCGLLMLLMRYRKRTRIVATLIDAPWITSFLLGYAPYKQIIKYVLYSISFLLLFVALLRPQWNKKEEIITEEGRDLYIVLDVSRSMLAQDVKPNRLAFSKEKIRQLARILESNRVGLLLFSGSAFVYCPLTSDLAAFNMFLDQVDAETISSGTTAIDQALEKVIQTVQSVPSRKSNIVVIFTDGEDFSSNLQRIKNDAAQHRLTIFTVGVGSQEGAPIPVVDDKGNQVGHQKDEDGSIVISRLDEKTIKNLAIDLGGHYIKATEDSSDIYQLQSYIQQFEKEAFDEKKMSALEEQFQWFVVPATIFLCIEWIL